MSSKLLFRILAAFGSRTSGNRKPHRRHYRRNLRIESLERRAMLSAIVDGNFNLPALAATAYVVAPPSVPAGSWTFSQGATANGFAGITGNSSPFTKYNPASPADLSQVALIKNDGAFSQTLSLTGGDCYAISFMAAERTPLGGQSFQVSIQESGDTTLPLQYRVTPPGDGYYHPYVLAFDVSGSGSKSCTIKFTGLVSSAAASAHSTAFVGMVGLTQEAGCTGDTSATIPPASAGYYENPNPSLAKISGVTFTGTSGVTLNTGLGNFGNGATADGGLQQGFIKNTGGMSFTFTAPASGSYSGWLTAARRSATQSNGQETLVISLYPTSQGPSNAAKFTLTPVDSTFTRYQTSEFQLASGTSYTLVLQGATSDVSTATGRPDTTVLIDNMGYGPASGVVDGGFETSSVAGTVNNWIGAFAASAASPWAFTGNAGISGNNSAFTSGNPAAPDGAQAAYLKTDTTQSSISQTVYLNAGTYDIGLLAAQRSVNTANQQIVVSVTQGAATVESAVIAPSGTTYVHYQTPQFVIDAAGFYTIGLAGGDTPGKGVDSTALVDAVSVVPVNV